MSIYLGQLGRMVELKCPATMRVTPAEAFSFRQTLEGRVKAQRRPVARRQWDLAVSEATRPRDIGAIAAFAAGEWGPGPFVFVSPDAPVVNLLSPDAASCAPGAHVLGSGVVVSEGGPLLTQEGWAGRSYAKNTVNSLFFGGERSPILPGVPVTASAYVQGAGAAGGVAWYDAAGLSVGSAVSTVTATAGTVVRSHVTATPAANAVSCRVFVNAATTKTARPALTWTDQLFEWGDGQGCPKAVLHGFTRDLTLALRDPRFGRYSSAAFTITEVG